MIYIIIAIMMKLMAFIFSYVAVCLRLLTPGGFRSIAVENMLLRQQLFALSRQQKRAPNRTFTDRLLFGMFTDSQGRVFIVEMQMNWTDSFRNRLLFGTSQALVKQLDSGEDYHLLQPVYGLGLVAEIYEKTKPEWYHHYQLVKKGDLDSDVIGHLQLIFIELPKFPIHSPDEKRLRLL